MQVASSDKMIKNSPYDVGLMTKPAVLTPTAAVARLQFVHIGLLILHGSVLLHDHEGVWVVCPFDLGQVHQLLRALHPGHVNNSGV